MGSGAHLHSIHSFHSVLQMGCAGTDRERLPVDCQACLIDVSVMLVTGGAWALCLAKLVLLCPLTGRSIHRPSTDKERTNPLKSTGAQHNLLTAQRDAQEREREHKGRISCGLLQSSLTGGCCTDLGSSSPQRAPRGALAPLRSPTASDGRFFLLLENELCFHSLFLMGATTQTQGGEK